MGKEIPWETRERAEELYIYDGLTYEAVAVETGVSEAQLKRWGADGHWKARKKEHRAELTDIRRNQVRVRKRLIDAAVNSLDPQQVYAFAALEKLAIAKAGLPVSPPEGRRIELDALPEINTPADAVDALQQVVELKLGRMLQGADDVSLSKIKEMKQALELIEKMKEKYSPDDGDKKDRVLDAEAIKRLREQLL